MTVKNILVWVLAAFFTINTVVFIITTADFNISTALVGAVGLIFIIYGIFGKKIDAFCEKGFGSALKGIFIVGVLAFFCIVLFTSISSRFNNARGNEEVIVILGAGIRGDRVSKVLETRLVKGLELYNENPEAVFVVSGGVGARASISEAAAMRNWLIKKGVPEDQIFTEEKSTSTEENMLFTKDLFEANGWPLDTSIAVVTNDFHCYRSMSYAKLAGFTNVKIAPANTALLVVVPSYLRETLAILALWVIKIPAHMLG